MNEEGTVAAAATFIGMVRAAHVIQEFKTIFIADHPFLYAIVTNDMKLLFFGHYMS